MKRNEFLASLLGIPLVSKLISEEKVENILPDVNKTYPLGEPSELLKYQICLNRDNKFDTIRYSFPNGTTYYDSQISWESDSNGDSVATVGEYKLRKKKV